MGIFHGYVSLLGILGSLFFKIADITDITLEEPAGAEKTREAKVSGEGASAGTFTAQGLTGMRSGCNYEVLSDQKPILYPPIDP
jgi:hypothetical protein